MEAEENVRHEKLQGPDQNQVDSKKENNITNCTDTILALKTLITMTLN